MPDENPDQQGVDLQALYDKGLPAKQTLDTAVQGRRINIDVRETRRVVLKYVNDIVQALAGHDEHSDISRQFSESSRGFTTFVGIDDPYADGAAHFYNEGKRHFFTGYGMLWEAAEDQGRE